MEKEYYQRSIKVLKKFIDEFEEYNLFEEYDDILYFSIREPEDNTILEMRFMNMREIHYTRHDYAYLYYLLSVSYANLSDTENAAIDFLDALQWNPFNTLVRLNLLQQIEDVSSDLYIEIADEGFEYAYNRENIVIIYTGLSRVYINMHQYEDAMALQHMH